VPIEDCLAAEAGRSATSTLALFVNEVTLLPVLMPFDPASTAPLYQRHISPDREVAALVRGI
jgi:hypothetical protein